VGAHHQNGPAKRAIKTIQDMTRAMMLHVSIHWPDEYDVRLWPYALDYAVWLYNHTPRMDSGLAPMEIFCGTKLNCEYLRRAKVFGCPTYVLDPKLQDSNKIPKWSPRARLGQFLGFSWQHSSSIGLIRNLRTNYITPQFHVVYAQQFFTVSGGAQNRPLEHLDPHKFTIYLKGKWATDDRVHTLDDWDPSHDGPLPDHAPNWDTSELIPPEPPDPRPRPVANTPLPSPLHVRFQPPPVHASAEGGEDLRSGPSQLSPSAQRPSPTQGILRNPRLSMDSSTVDAQSLDALGNLDEIADPEPGTTKIMLPTSEAEAHGHDNAPEPAQPPPTNTQQESAQVPEVPEQPTL